MPKGGKGGPKPQMTDMTTTTTVDPASQAYIENFLRPMGQNAANQIAGMGPLAPNAATNTAVQQALMAQNPQLQQFQGFNPMNVEAGPGIGDLFSRYANQFGAHVGASPTVEVGKFDQARIQEFFNPYEAEVVGSTQGDFDRQREMVRQRAAQQATADAAFGGSRSAILEAQGLADVGSQEAQTLADLRYRGYEGARQAALQDWMNQNQLALSASAQGGGTSQALNLAFQAAQADAERQMQAALANQQAGLQGAGLNIQGLTQANQAALAGAGFDLDRIGAIAGLGGQQFGQQQASQQQAVQNWLAAVQAGTQGLGPTGTVQHQLGTQTPAQGGNNPLGGALGGAQIGAGVGGPWGAAIGGGLGLLGGMFF